MYSKLIKFNPVLFSIFIFLSLFQNIFSYISIPFKTFHPQYPSSDNLAEDFLRQTINNTLYVELELGSPPQTIPALLLSEEFGLFIINKKCLIPSNFQDIEKSSTFIKTELHKNFTFKFRTQTDMLLGTEIFKFNMNNNIKKQVILDFMYSPNLYEKSSIKEKNCENHFADDNNHEYTCVGIGIREEQYLGRDYESNFIKQLFYKEIINNNYFSIIYDKNSDETGILLVGAEPHIYDKNNFYEKQLRHISSKGHNFFIFWSLTPDKIFFSVNNQNINITNNLLCSIEYNLGVIYGTENYFELIKQHFFNKLIQEKKCHEEIINSAYTLFYCYNKNDIEKFPTLNFFFQQFLYTFKLDYNDLFQEKNGKYFFKIIFDKNNKMQWKLGKPFLKKYTFLYDYDAKTVGFYNMDLLREKKNKTISNIFLNIFYFIVICFFGYIGFFYGKKAYDKVRKKRIYEIEDNYEYKGEEKKGNNSFLEMMIKPK
jgi:hypothetical protein